MGWIWVVVGSLRCPLMTTQHSRTIVCNLHTHTHTRTNTHTHHTLKDIHTCTYTHLHAYTLTHTHTHTDTHTHMHAHTHTHIHTCTRVYDTCLQHTHSLPAFPASSLHISRYPTIYWSCI